MFSHKCKFCIIQNWFITKIILIAQKYLFYGYSEWWQIKQIASSLKISLSSNTRWLGSEPYEI